METTINLPAQTRAAEVSASSYDEAANTIDVIWTTGATVRRRSWDIGDFDEELVVSANAVRLERLNLGAPFLNTHSTYDLGDVIGSVVPGTAEIRGGKGYAKVQLSRAEGDADIVSKIRDGIIRNISVGYRIHAVEKTEAQDGKIAQVRVTDWEPMEISAVPVPADAGSQVRAHKPDLFPCVVAQTGGDDQANQDSAARAAGIEGETPMTVRTEQQIADDKAEAVRIAREEGKAEAAAAHEAALVAARAVDKADAQKQARIDEQKRCADIREIAAGAGHKEFGERHIEAGTAVEVFRAVLSEKLYAEAGARVAGNSNIGDGAREGGREGDNRVLGDANAEARAEAVTTALLHRYDAGKYQLDDKARDFRGMSLLEIGRSCLEAQGVDTRGWSRQEVAERSLAAGTRAGGLGTTGDFPNILANVANKTLRDAYEAAPQTFRPLVRETTVPDFKPVSRTQLGEAPSFEKVNEHGEFKRGSLGDGSEKYQVYTYGKVVGITRQVIVNDDLNAFTRLPTAFGVQAANLESDLVWAAILSNPVMGDGVALFHATHKNLAAAGTVLDIPNLGLARLAMRKQVGLDGKTLLNVTPRYLVVPAALESATDKLVADTRPTKSDDVTPSFIKSLQPISEPRLDVGFVNPATGAAVAGSALSWYLAAAAGAIDTVELAYLEGNRGVYTETRVGFDIDGVEVKVRMDAGAKVIDWRSFYKNAGA